MEAHAGETITGLEIFSLPAEPVANAPSRIAPLSSTAAASTRMAAPSPTPNGIVGNAATTLAVLKAIMLAAPLDVVLVAMGDLAIPDGSGSTIGLLFHRPVFSWALSGAGADQASRIRCMHMAPVPIHWIPICEERAHSRTPPFPAMDCAGPETHAKGGSLDTLPNSDSGAHACG